MRKRSTSELGDPSDPAHEGNVKQWVLGGTDANDADALFIVASDRADDRQREIQRLHQWFATCATCVYSETGQVLSGGLKGHEHFGWRDGVSQPAVRGRVAIAGGGAQYFTPRTAERPHQGLPGQDLIWPGEFVFAYPKQTDTSTTAPGSVAVAGPEWAKNGSYLVFRRLRQKVPEFHQFIHTEATRLGINPVLLGSRLVGRWPSGAPLVLTANRDDETLGGRYEDRNNDFEFNITDPNGARCPFSAHIRKMYPRDDVSTNPAIPLREETTQTHRIMRRGFPFGQPSASKVDKPVPPGLLTATTKGEDRGLMFVCYQTNIQQQFEFLQKNWANNVDFKDTNVGHDAIIGQSNVAGNPPNRTRTVDIKLAGDASTLLQIADDFVIPTGGGYFFTPSFHALENVILIGASAPNVYGYKEHHAKIAKPASSVPQIEDDKYADLLQQIEIVKGRLRALQSASASPSECSRLQKVLAELQAEAQSFAKRFDIK